MLWHIARKLADTQFDILSSVDILIGTEIFFDVMVTEKWPISFFESDILLLFVLAIVFYLSVFYLLGYIIIFNWLY